MPFLLGDEMNAKVIDMTGKRFASLVAIHQTGISASRDLTWLFACDCGNKFEANGYYARCGKITTCPSCSKERVRRSSITHGMSESPEFSTWTDIQSRCYNQRTKAYKDYGGRGILVCDRWLESFENFLVDMGKRPSKQHSIDRINNDGNYEPDNCRWATRKEQANNKRCTIRIPSAEGKWIRELAVDIGITYSAMWLRVKKGKSTDIMRQSKRLGSITYNGITDTYNGWSNRTGIKPSTISMRITKYGWPIHRALTQGALL